MLIGLVIVRVEQAKFGHGNFVKYIFSKANAQSWF